MRPSLGEFLTAASDHIDVVTGGEVPAEAAHAVVPQLGRITAAMARFADAFTAHDETGSLHLLDSQARAVLDARTALRQSAARMRTAAGVLGNGGDSQDHPCAARLATAADCLAVGDDLLQTHFRPGPFGSRLGNSSWAPVIASAAVRTALVAEMAGYARRLAPWALQLSMARPGGPGLPPRARMHISATCRSLRVAEAAAWAASHDRNLAATRTLLHTIPVNAVPPRCPPRGCEPVPGLCAGAMATAERLRHLAHVAAAGSSVPHAGMTLSWQRTAQGAAIAGHGSELRLRRLAQPDGPPLSPAAVTALRTATDATSQAWAAWRNVVHQWDTFTTGRSAMLTPVAVEIGDLVLWVGRLAHTDPAWTPARGHTSPLRPATTMADGPDAINGIVAALHQASDALAHIAARDRQAVDAAEAHGGLFVPTRLLPSTYDVPYRYAPSPPSMTAALLAIYDDATAASAHAATALDNLTLTLGARPTVRAAPQAVSSQDMPHLLYTAPPVVRAGAQQPSPGQVEQALRNRGVSDPTLLAQAADLDDATQSLITAASAISERQTTAHQAALPADQGHPATGTHPPSLTAQDSSPSMASAGLPPRVAAAHLPSRGRRSHRHL